jgi:glycosyltransferase involved in cell wall biosynthesis
MAGDPLVSVIVPAYNAEQFIEESLRSALVQTWTRLELIVVDDGSVDSTAEIAARLGDKRIRVIGQENRGAAAARNTGLMNATGKYVQFLDADDILSTSKIELQTIALEHAGPDTIASCSWAHFAVDPAHSVIEPQPVWSEERPLEWLILSAAGGGMMQPAAWLTPRSLIDKAGPWNESLTLHDDGEFFARILVNASRNIFVRDALIYYRGVRGSLSRTRGRKAAESAYEVCSAKAHLIMSKRDDNAARRAVATEFARFVYEFHTSAPDLAEKSLSEMRNLGVAPAPSVGGGIFQGLSAIVGFERALRVRAALASN